MKYWEETTIWENRSIKNGTYYLSDDKSSMVGFISHGQTEMKIFKSPIKISTTGRKFKLIKDGEPDSVYFGKKTVEASSIEVEGSGGKKYFVTKHGSTLTCTCSGLQFRNKCKHVEQIKG